MKYSVNCKTEIIATTGPSLHTVEQLCYAMSLGIRNFRLALSSRERDVCQYIRNIRIAEKRSGSKAEVLLDFPADRPRTAEMEPTLLKENCIYVFCDTDKKRGDEIAVNGFESVINLLKENDRIFFRDGKIQLRVKDINLAERKVSALCYNSTTDLRTNCSCVFPDTDIIYQPIVDLDIQALERLRKSGLSPDWFALSFASDKASVKMMRDLAEKFWLSKRIKVMAKIETKKGIDHIKEILQESDGIMVARGDLLLHIPPVKLPRVQEYLVEMAKKYRKVSVVATEFLEIFATTGIVNRAELSDIALGARQKATALMLSMESANSHYSKECLELMAGVIDELYERKE